MRTRPRTLSVALAALGCLALAACAGAPPAAGPAAGTGLEKYYGQTLAWGPCTPFATTDEERTAYAAAELDCAKLEVPLDYAAPADRTAQIAVLRARSTAPDRIGSLVMNPGGPGGSGVEAAARMAGSLAGGPFDVVGFDPRGVGSSTPKLQCLKPEEFLAERADVDVDPSPAGVEQTEAENRQWGEKCLQRSGGVEVLANAGTRDVVRDLDVLRAALGDEKLTYLGYSYGTRIGAACAEAFPKNVRAMLLDGAEDLSQRKADADIEQAAAFQAAFDAFAADCVSRPGCPLGTDATSATAAFQALTRPLIDKPAPAGTRTLSYGDAIQGVMLAGYNKSLWPRLETALSGLAAGDGSTLLAMADDYFGILSADAFQVISCEDGDRIPDRAAAADIAERGNKAAPFADSGRGAVAALDPCALFPAPPSSSPHQPNFAGLPPVLVVSTTGDPATPYRAGVDLAKAMKGTLLTVEGNQHTAMFNSGNDCIDGIGVDYLRDLTVPAEGTRCTLS